MSADAEDTPATGDAANARAIADAQRRLARRPWPAAELRRALLTAGHAEAAVESAIDAATDAGWLDDAATARGHAEALIAREAADPRWIEARLEARAIDPATAADVARAAVPDRQAAVDAAVAAAVARLTPRDRDADGHPRVAATVRIARRLAGRGFEEDAILSAFDRAGVRLTDHRTSGGSISRRTEDDIAADARVPVHHDEADPPAPE